jgi:hypothetical protein
MCSEFQNLNIEEVMLNLCESQGIVGLKNSNPSDSPLHIYNTWKILIYINCSVSFLPGRDERSRYSDQLERNRYDDPAPQREDPRGLVDRRLGVDPRNFPEERRGY